MPGRTGRTATSGLAGSGPPARSLGCRVRRICAGSAPTGPGP